MAQDPWTTDGQRSEEFGELQELVDSLFAEKRHVDRMDAVVAAEARDLDEELVAIVRMLPPGTRNRASFTEQLNSTLAARGWGRRFGLVS